MTVSRRQLLTRALFGTGLLGLRALATGLPASFLLNPRRALASNGAAGCSDPTKAQYIIFSTSGGGDPINAGAPGTYSNPAIVHSPDPSMAPTSVTFGGTTTTAALPWSTLPASVRAHTTFWHLMTDTPIHPKEPEVLRLMGATALNANNEMLPSLLAKAVSPCLNTIQPQPISLIPGAPSETLSYDGATMPAIPPLALKDTLTDPAGPLTQLQSLRDSTMSSIYDLYKNAATPPQQSFIDQMALSQQQVRMLNQNLLSTLGSIQDNFIWSQMLAAVTLIQMNIAPVIAVHIPFGGDNHVDKGLAFETAQTVGTAKQPTGVAAIAYLMQLLQTAKDGAGNGLANRVSLVSLDVFGRTLLTNAGGSAQDGRGHNPNHQVSFTIGAPFNGGVIGGCGPAGVDIGCTSIDSSSGASGGDIQPVDTLAAYAQTLLAAVGGDPTLVQSPNGTARVVSAALA